MKKLILTLAAFGLSSVAMAGPSWTYVDLGYVVGDSEGDDNDVDGFSLRGSLGFAGIWHVQLDYLDVDFDQFDASFDGFELRGGIHPAATDNTDFVLDIGYFDGTFEESGEADVDADGFTFRTGVRSNISDNNELRSFISLTYGDIDGEGDFTDIGYSVGGQYNFNEAWSVGVDASVGGDDLANLYVRWSFGDLM